MSQLEHNTAVTLENERIITAFYGPEVEPFEVIPRLVGRFALLHEDVMRTHTAPFLMNFDELRANLDEEEAAYAKRLMLLDPEEYGIKDPMYGIQNPSAKDQVALSQTTVYEGITRIHPTQNLPHHAWLAYSSLRQAYQQDTGRDMLLGSGFRGAPYTVFNVMQWLHKYKNDMHKTLQYVSLPGRSEHNLTGKVALDFMTQEGIWLFDDPPVNAQGEPSSVRFDDTKEFEWLLENAGEHGFKHTAPRDHPTGIAYEPWHWQLQRMPA